MNGGNGNGTGRTSSNRIAVAVGDGCSKNKHAAAPVAVHDSSKVQRRWWLVKEEEEAAAVRCCDETMPWNVGGVRDDGAEQRWSSEKGGAMRWWLVEEEEAKALERRDGGVEPRWSVGGAPEVRRTMGPVREGGAGRRRNEGWPEKTISQKNGEDEIAEQQRNWGFLTLRRDTASVRR